MLFLTAIAGCQKQESAIPIPPEPTNKISNLNVLNPGFFIHKTTDDKMFIAGSDGKIISNYSSDAQWQAVSTIGFSDKINALAANDTGNIVLAVGENGLIARSDDSGHHWQKLTSPTIKTLTAIAFDSKHQRWIAAGEQGQFLQADAKGDSWQQAPFNSAATISKILVLPTQVIAIGENGLIANSADGGHEWKINPSISSAALTDIIAVDHQVFISTADGNLVRGDLASDSELNNNIKNWTLIPSGTNHYLSRIFYHSQENLLITLSSEGDILLSDDGGNLWAPVSQNNKYLNDIKQSNDGHYLLAAGDHGQLLLSDNGGRTWSSLTSPINTNIEGIIADGKNGFIAYGEAGLLMQKQNIHDEWKIINYPVKEFIHQLVPDTPDNWFAMGAKGTLIHSKDHGQSWQPIAAGSQEIDYFLSAVTDKKSGSLITAGPPGTILVKKKHSDEWQVRLSLSDSNRGYFHRLATNDKGTIVAVAGPGTTHYSTDAGENWHPADIDNSKQLFNVIYDQYHQQFIAVGQEGTIQLSADGKTWNRVATGIPQSLQTVFATEPRLWAAGDKGVLIQSTDAGKTWQDAEIGPISPASNSQSTILALFATQEGNLIASGAQGFIARLASSGNHWELITSPTQSSLRTPVQHGATGIIYIPGKTGEIIYSKDDGLHWELLPPMTQGSLKNLYIDNSNNMLIGVGERLIRTPLLTPE